MACRILRVSEIITNTFRHCHAVNSGVSAAAVALLRPSTSLVQNVRKTSFFNKRPAQQLWKGVTSVSNAGKRRGRAKGLIRRKDLNRGQIIGVGKIGMQFPGLNAPVFQGREILEQRPISSKENVDIQEKLLKIRDSMTARRRQRVSPLDRGWSGGKAGGKRIGPPDPIGEDTFEGFETWILESKLVAHMTGNLGRKIRASAFVITGNGNGLAGFALAKASHNQAAWRTAKNRAGQKLMYIERFQENTVLHDFYTCFGNSKLYVRQMPEGYGLVCHRAIKACCEAIGIKNLYAKSEGSRNVQNIVKAFFVGLLRQKSFQTMANEKGLHLVQLRKECNYYPQVLASPAVVRKQSEIKPNEILDFNQYIMDGKVRLQKKKPLPFYTKLPSWQTHLRKMERRRDQHDVRLQLKAEYGELRSFLADKYPECVAKKFKKKGNQEEVEE